MLKKLWILGWDTYRGFTRDDCFQLAAAISYYVLFSILPLLILVVSVFGFFLRNQDLLDSLANHIVDYLPLSSIDGRRSVEDALNSVKNASGPGALIGLVATAWASTAVFTSIRKALNRIWGVTEQRNYARQKLADLLQVGLIGGVLITSVVATGVLRVMRAHAPSGIRAFSGSSPLWEVPTVVLPAFLTFLLFLAVYRIVPTSHPRVRSILPGALIATLLFEVLKNTFAIYVAHFNNYSVVYGSLAGVFLFLLFMYMAACILLVGAELSRTLERYHAGELDLALAPAPGPQPPVATRALRAVKGLFARQHP